MERRSGIEREETDSEEEDLEDTDIKLTSIEQHELFGPSDFLTLMDFDVSEKGG